MAAVLKACKSCGQELPTSSFHKDNAQRDGLQSKCVSCQAEVDRKWYIENREDYIASRMVRQKKFILDLNLWKMAQGCASCGTRELPLDHHHTDPASKRVDVSMMYSYSLESLYDEIAKCVVLCRSCHLKLRVLPPRKARVEVAV